MKQKWPALRVMRVPLLFALAWNMIVYSGTRLIASGWVHHTIETPWDRMIPFVPWTVTIYLGCYLFWGVNYILGACQGEKEGYRLLSADFLGKAVCLIFFLVFPTTNVRPAAEGVTIWEKAMQFVYTIDAADNLFPSIHCMVSWFSYIGIRRNSLIPKWYRVFSLLFALAVCVSTLTTKQHVIADTFSGVLLAEGCYWLTDKTGFAERYRRIFTYLFSALTDTKS